MNKLARDYNLPQPECNTSVLAHDGKSYTALSASRNSSSSESSIE
jgi:hypothetical protein